MFGAEFGVLVFRAACFHAVGTHQDEMSHPLLLGGCDGAFHTPELAFLVGDAFGGKFTQDADQVDDRIRPCRQFSSAMASLMSPGMVSQCSAWRSLFAAGANQYPWRVSGCQ